jgi:hypothetical protein
MAKVGQNHKVTVMGLDRGCPGGNTDDMVTATPSPAIGSPLPLLFTYRDRVFGNGFAADVCAENGRALCVREADGFWMYGVNPGGMAAFGEDPVAAHRAFRKTFSRVLVDIASESGSFAEFQQNVREFFDETNEGHAVDWNAAVLKVRADEVIAEGIPKLPAESARTITIEQKHEPQFTVADNRPSEFKRALAA